MGANGGNNSLANRKTTPNAIQKLDKCSRRQWVGALKVGKSAFGSTPAISDVKCATKVLNSALAKTYVCCISTCRVSGKCKNMSSLCCVQKSFVAITKPSSSLNALHEWSLHWYCFADLWNECWTWRESLTLRSESQSYRKVCKRARIIIHFPIDTAFWKFQFGKWLPPGFVAGDYESMPLSKALQNRFWSVKFKFWQQQFMKMVAFYLFCSVNGEKQWFVMIFMHDFKLSFFLFLDGLRSLSHFKTKLIRFSNLCLTQASLSLLFISVVHSNSSLNCFAV